MFTEPGDCDMASTSTGSNKRPHESECNADATKRHCHEVEENEFDVTTLPLDISTAIEMNVSHLQQPTTNEHGIFNV